MSVFVLWWLGWIDQLLSLRKLKKEIVKNLSSGKTSQHYPIISKHHIFSCIYIYIYLIVTVFIRVKQNTNQALHYIFKSLCLRKPSKCFKFNCKWFKGTESDFTNMQ